MKVLEEKSVNASGNNLLSRDRWKGLNPDYIRGYTMSNIKQEGMLESTGAGAQYGHGAYAFETPLDAMRIANRTDGRGLHCGRRR
jgi:hypothetical protein